MSSAAAVTAGLAALEAAGPLIEKLIQWADAGLSNDEMRARLGDPDHVGDDILNRVRKRRKRGRELLGRDPKPG